MTPILPCGGCSACERCEALRWACRACLEHPRLAKMAAERQLVATSPSRFVAFHEFLVALLDPARAAELLRALLEARGVLAENFTGTPTSRALMVWACGSEIYMRFEHRWGPWEHGVCTLGVSGAAALILALLANPPGEQREAAMLAVEAAR